ncbi:MAG: hypothetical protein IJE14_05690 [Clostridia bacterium]|nr:hypothetical protein [Clostridia bacterium]
MTEKPYKPTTDDKQAKNTIYTPMPHRYGYLIRVNHPEIQPYYEAFKESIGEPKHFPISRDERIAFEYLVLCGHYPIRLKRA